MNPVQRPNQEKKRLTIVLPAKDEERGIRRLLRSLPLSTLRAMELDVDVLVLDGSSRDATAAIAREWGATVVPDREPGKGAAVRNAMPHVRGDYVVMLDADGTYPPDAIPRLVGPLVRNEADIVMGVRLPQPGAMTGTHVFGNVVLSVLASVLYTRPCPDVCTGLWGFRADALRSMPLQSSGFGLEAELFALATRLRLRMAHVRADYLPRNGHTKLTFGPDGLRIIRRLMLARFAPLPVAPSDGTPAPPAPVEVRAR